MVWAKRIIRVLLGFIVGLVVVLVLLMPHHVQAEDSLRKQAQTLTEQGQKALDRGQPSQALQFWANAYSLYQELQFQSGITGTLINQSTAYQELGEINQACHVLIKALGIDEWCQTPPSLDKLKQYLGTLQLDNPIQLLGYKNLGDVLRSLGQSRSSELILQQALAASIRLSRSPDDILLSLGNTYRVLFRQSRDRYNLTSDPVLGGAMQVQAKKHLKKAKELYEQVESGEFGFLARLNWLNLLIEVNEWTESNDLSKKLDLVQIEQEYRLQLKPALDDLLGYEQLFKRQVNGRSSKAKVSIAQALVKLNKLNIKNKLMLNSEQLLSKGLLLTQEASEVATSLADIRTQAYSFATFSEIYNELGDDKRHKKYLEKAVALAQSTQIRDIAYKWQFELGKIYKQEGNLIQAVKFYEAAFKSLDKTRKNLLLLPIDSQLSFQEEIAPIFQNYIQLLLSQPNPDLLKVVKVNESLQLLELKNYLRCEQLNLELQPISRIINLPETPTIFYVLNLNEKIEVLVRAKDGRFLHYSPDYQTVINSVNQLLITIEDPNFRYTTDQQIQARTQPIYEALIAPARQKGYLPQEGTLVFIVDDSLQNIPMALLYGGQRYLIEDYSLVSMLKSQTLDLKPLQPKQKALIAGLSLASPSLKNPIVPPDLTPLETVETETEKVKQLTSSSLKIMNEKFTVQQFQKLFENTDYPIVHIGTHGQFSSDPERTFLLAWDRPINATELSQLFKQDRQHLIELLVLSACETAKGDSRSALGIAGIASQAGARSTLASLWLVDDYSTSELMSHFYQALNQGQNKAEALRSAQVKLLRDGQYSPYNWAAFILVGNWV
jgi:CHAT domain-containing protein